MAGGLVWLALALGQPAAFAQMARPLISAGDLVDPHQPRFQDYVSAPLYEGPRARVQLRTPFAQRFRSELLDTESEAINFAGEYVVSVWGCGTDCLSGAVVSARTGKVIPLPTLCCWEGNEEEQLIFFPNSRLLVLSGIVQQGGEYGSHFYDITTQGLTRIRTLLRPR